MKTLAGVLVMASELMWITKANGQRDWCGIRGSNGRKTRRRALAHDRANGGRRDRRGSRWPSSQRREAMSFPRALQFLRVTLRWLQRAQFAVIATWKPARRMRYGLRTGIKERKDLTDTEGCNFPFLVTDNVPSRS